MELSSNEEEIITAIRALKPFEEVIVRADNKGTLDNYLIIKSHKFYLNKEGKLPVK